MSTNTYVALDKVTASGSASSITFSSIPSTYTDLVIVAQTSVASGSYQNQLQVNGDTGTNYSTTYLSGSGSAVTSTRGSNVSQAVLGYDDYNTTAIGQMTTIHLMNYANTTTYKTILARGSNANTGVSTTVSLWRSTAAITSVTVKNSGGVNYASGSTFSLYGIKAEGVSPAPKATGGAIYSDDTYYYHVFGSTGTFTPNQSLSCDFVIVGGGGGGGGANAGGGGGAGGLVYKTGISATATPYTITVGAGGTGQIPASGGGSNGGDSSALTYTGTGGGCGGYWGNSSSRNGASGGSGGGGGEYAGAGTAGSSTQTSYSGAGFGNAGGAPYVNGGDIRTGGGGGAGAVGGAGVSGGNAGSGGIGKYYDDFGAATGAGQYINSHYYFAGGGGGSQYANGSLNGVGGYGGGGAGGTGSTNNAVAGMANTGGGGGGSGYQNASNTTRVNGGSGVVIVRYAK